MIDRLKELHKEIYKDWYNSKIEKDVYLKLSEQLIDIIVDLELKEKQEGKQ